MFRIMTPKELVSYLLELGLLTSSSIVDGDLVVAEITRRHRNFAVVRTKAPGFFVKVAQVNPNAIEALQHEAACYLMIKEHPQLAPLAALMPLFHLYDSNRQVLIVELIPKAETLFAYHRRIGRIPDTVASDLGRALAICHSSTSEHLSALSYQAVKGSLFAHQIPWSLSLHRAQASDILNLSPANAQMLAILQHHPEFTAALDQIRSEWTFQTLIHGDMRLDNCLVGSSNGAGAGPTLKLVDWEFAAVGDPCFDVGTILEAFVSLWVAACVPQLQTAGPIGHGAKRATSLQDVHSLSRAFWGGYLSVMCIGEGTARELLTRSARYAAARVIQTVFEANCNSAALGVQSALMLQVSLNILARPADAIEQLMGL
jgi:hypothetical protein